MQITKKLSKIAEKGTTLTQKEKAGHLIDRLTLLFLHKEYVKTYYY